MEETIKSFKKLISDTIEQNEKINGVHLLETLKYILIENLKDIDNKVIFDAFKDINKDDFLEIFENKSIISRIYFYSDSFTKIKSKYEEDTLLIIIEGHKSVSIMDDNVKEKNNLQIMKNMGIVLCKNTITSEKTSSNSIILNIMSKNIDLNIEK